MKKTHLLATAYVSVLFLCISSSPDASIVAPAGLEAGDKFHIIFVSTTVRDPTSSDITDYDAHVQAAANAAEIGSTIGGNTIELNGWRALGSTLTVDAVDHLAPLFSSTTNVPIYNLNNDANQHGDLVSTNFTGLWDADGLGGGGLDGPVSYNEYGNFINTTVWTGSGPDGNRFQSAPPTDNFYLGSTDKVTAGQSNQVNAGWTTYTSQPFNLDPTLSLYGVSQELLIASNGDVVLAPVSIPATAWLFGSGLLGLVGMARRKKAA